MLGPQREQNTVILSACPVRMARRISQYRYRGMLRRDPSLVLLSMTLSLAAREGDARTGPGARIAPLIPQNRTFSLFIPLVRLQSWPL